MTEFLLAGLGVVALVALGARPAAAQTTSPTQAPPNEVACRQWAYSNEANSASGSLIGKYSPVAGPDERPGCFNTSAYTVDFEEGSPWSLTRKVMGASTEFFFGITRFLVGIGLEVVSWAFTFALARQLADPVAGIAGRYQAALDSGGSVTVVGFVLFLAAAYGGWHMLRGRIAKGAGEFGVSVVIVALAGAFLLSRPADFLNASLDHTAELSGATVSLALNCGDSCNTHKYQPCPHIRGEDCGEDVFSNYKGLVHPLERGIHSAFIDSPYDLIQWGDMLDGNPTYESGARNICLQHRDEILAKSPGGNRDQIVAIMNGGDGASDKGTGHDGQVSIGPFSFDPRPWKWFDTSQAGQGTPCHDLWTLNREPSMERLGVAVLSLFSALIVIILLVLVAATIVAAQLVAVALIAVLPFAVLGGALPGAGRAFLWRWVAMYARALLAILMMSLFLAFLLITTRAVLSAESGTSLLIREASLNLVTILAFVARKRILAAGHRIGHNTGARLSRMHIGGSHGAQVVGPAGAGLGGRGLGREIKGEVAHVVRPALWATQKAVTTGAVVGGAVAGGIGLAAAAGGAAGASAAGGAGAGAAGAAKGAGPVGGTAAGEAQRAGGARQAWRSSRRAHQAVTGIISNDSVGDVAAHAMAASGFSQQFPKSPVGDLSSAQAQRKRAELLALLTSRAPRGQSAPGVESPAGAVGSARPPGGSPEDPAGGDGSAPLSGAVEPAALAAEAARLDGRRARAEVRAWPVGPPANKAPMRPPRGIAFSRAVCTCGESGFETWNEALAHATEDGHALRLGDGPRTPAGAGRTT